MATLRQVNDDEFFNHRAAQQAYDMVMAMDDDTAVEFAKNLSYELLHEDIRNNRRTLDRHTRDVSKRMLNGAAAGVRRGMIDMEVYEELSKQLSPVLEVSKADWDEAEVKRDKGGRFSKVESRIRTGNGGKPMSKKTERQMGIPSAKKNAAASAKLPGAHKLSPAERANYQRQYLQLVDRLDAFTDKGVSNPTMVIRNKQDGALLEMGAVQDGVPGRGWNPSTHDLVQVRGDRGGRGQNPDFDLVSALGSRERGVQRMDAAGDRIDSIAGDGNNTFASRWNDASGDTPGTNERTYRRVAAGASLVQDLNRDPVTGLPRSMKVEAAARTANVVGQYGPKAEQVLGPQARKTAYRYRGTERKPDQALLKMQESAVNMATAPDRDMSPAQLVAFRARGGEASAEQKQMASSKAAQQYLFGRVPDPKMSEIHRKAGKIPPSEGVIIGADGEIKTQAVGFADDHYLPFNLKNLKGLKGGQYVRTRTSGGLTTEDIYTGLVSGARSVTVVSNSGIFTIDFADDLRGGRRMSDKASSMVGQYGKTLDAIKEGKIEKAPLDAGTRAQILEDVQQEYKGIPVTRAEIQGEYQRRVKEYRELPMLSEKELKDIDASVAESYPEGGRKAQEMRLELQDAALETRQDRHYKLDGEGYAAAARALREQYPYFIGAVEYQTKNSRKAWDSDRPSEQSPEMARRLNSTKDSGYVKPRHNRPEEAMSGYYDKTIAGEGGVAGTGKTKASETNYQNWEHNPNRARARTRSAERATETQTEESKPSMSSTPNRASGAPKTPDQRQRQMDQARAQREVRVQASKIISDGFKGYEATEIRQHAPRLADAIESGDIEAALADPSARDKIKSELENMSNAEDKTQQFVKASARAFKLLDQDVSGEWSRKKLGERSKEGFSFDGAAYTSKHASKEVIDAEKKRVYNAYNVGNLQGLQDDELADLSRDAGRLANALESGDENRISTAATEYALTAGLQDTTSLLQGLSRGEPKDHAQRYARVSEGIERLRALDKNEKNIGLGEVRVPDDISELEAAAIRDPRTMPKKQGSSSPNRGEYRPGKATQASEPPKPSAIEFKNSVVTEMARGYEASGNRDALVALQYIGSAIDSGSFTRAKKAMELVTSRNHHGIAPEDLDDLSDLIDELDD